MVTKTVKKFGPSLVSWKDIRGRLVGEESFFEYPGFGTNAFLFVCTPWEIISTPSSTPPLLINISRSGTPVTDENKNTYWAYSIEILGSEIWIMWAEMVLGEIFK